MKTNANDAKKSTAQDVTSGKNTCRCQICDEEKKKIFIIVDNKVICKTCAKKMKKRLEKRRDILAKYMRKIANL